MYSILRKSGSAKILCGRGFTPPSKTAGFTLIELMVSLTIFSILMVVSVGTLLSLLDVNAKAQALFSATTNLSFALDSITREIRTGHYYNCKSASIDQSADPLPGGNGTLPPADCDNDHSKNEIIFIRDRDGLKIGYRFYEKKIQQKIELLDGTAPNGWEDVTSTDVEIEEFKIVVTDSDYYSKVGPGAGDKDQPIVTLHIKGKVANNNGLEGETDFNIQTLIVQRRLDQV